MKDYGSNDLHKAYGGNTKIKYADYVRVLKRYNTLIIEGVAGGSSWNLPFNMGTISTVVNTRRFTSKVVNWPESNKLKQSIIDRGGVPREKGSEEGESWIVYYTDEFFCRIKWDKKNTKGKSVKNWKIYKFSPAWGFRRFLSKKLKEDELNELLI
jgi:hypothetical protein